jgi:hypothetical protein
MPNFAVVENGVVTNIIVAETQDIAIATTAKLCVEYNPELLCVQIGTEYSGTDFVIPELVAPVVEEPVIDEPVAE